MWILCRCKYIISHNILDHISILMARQYFGPLPIISVSQGHFSRTDMAASRDRDLVKMQEIRNLNRRYSVFSQIDFRWDCEKTRMERFFRIEVWIAITRLILYWMFTKGLEPTFFTSENSNFELIKFSVIYLEGSLEQVVCSNCWLLRSAVSQWGGEGRPTNPRKHRPTNTNTQNTNTSAVQIRLQTTGWFFRSLQCTAVYRKSQILLEKKKSLNFDLRWIFSCLHLLGVEELLKFRF